MKKCLLKIMMLIVGSNIATLGNQLSIIQTPSIDTTTQISLKLGEASIGGDTRPNAGITGGVTLTKPLKNGWAIALDVTGAGLQIKPKKGYSYEGKTSVLQITPNLKYNILKNNTNFELSPYLGIGYIYLNPQNSLNGKVIRYANGTSSSPKGVSSFVVPFGLELGKLLSNGNKIGISAFMNYTNTDRLDGVVGTLGGDDNRPNRNPHLYEGLLIDYDKESRSSKNDYWGGVLIYYKISLKK